MVSGESGHRFAHGGKKLKLMVYATILTAR